MKLLYRRCAGLDVHKMSVTACVRRRVPGSSETEMEEAVFGTFTQDLVRLRQCFTVAITPRPLAPARPIVDVSVCRKCARWGLPQCLHYFPKPKRTNRPRKPKDSAT